LTIESPPAHLKRVLRQRQVVALAFGAIMGWSWVLLTGVWIGRAGSLGAALAFGATGVAIALIALTYAELVSALPKAGGEHVYSARAFGPGLSFVCTWALLLGYVSVVAFESVALPVALSYLFPELRMGRLWSIAGADVYASHIAIGIGGALLLTTVNAWGIAAAARLQGVVTGLIAVAGVVLVVGSIGSGSLSNMEPLFTGGFAGALGVVVMLPLMFLGFDVIPQAAEEIDLPPRRIGWLIVVSMLCAGGFYIAVVLAVAFALGGDARTASDLPTADAAAAAWSSPWAGVLLIAGGVAGIVTTWNALLVGSSRLVYALAKDEMLPASLGTLHPRHANPTRALWWICAVSCIAPWFGRPALVWLVDAGSLGVVVAYAIVALSFLALRKKEPALPRPYRVPGGAVIGWLAFVMAFAIGLLYLPGSPAALIWPQEWAICLGWIGVGGLFYGLQRRRLLDH
jgi:amino acid transporter